MNLKMENEMTLMFTQLRMPIIILLIGLIFNVVVLFFLEKKIEIRQLTFINLVILFATSVSLLTQSSSIIKQFNLAGDPFSYYVVLISSLLFFVGVFTFTNKVKKDMKKEKDNDK